MKEMPQIGDKLNFRKFYWKIVRYEVSPWTRETFYRYRVYRKYFRRMIPLSYTKQDYFISKGKWEYYLSKLAKNPTYHYNTTN